MSEESTTPDLVEVVRAAFEAGDRQALDTVMSIFGPDVVLDLSRIGLGSYLGHEAVREFLADWWGSYEEFENKPEIIDLENGVVLTINHQVARPTGVSGQVELRDAYILLFSEAGVLVRWTAYSDIDEARAAAEHLAQERG